jgi:hypothetical protein
MATGNRCRRGVPLLAQGACMGFASPCPTSPGLRRGLVWEPRHPAVEALSVSDRIAANRDLGTDHILKLNVCQRSRRSHWPTVRLPTLILAVPRMPGVSTPWASSSDVIAS